MSQHPSKISGKQSYITPRIKQVQEYTKTLLDKRTHHTHDIHMALRKVFTDHAVYTKFVITDILESLSNATSDLARLLKNQDDIANVLMPYIGIDRSATLAQLLKTHIERAGNCLTALKSGNATELTNAVTALFENSDQIGMFLSNLNPMLGNMPTLFRQHNQYVIDIAKAQFAKQYDTVVSLYDAYYEHMMMIADCIYVGIKQN